ncbi:MAG TPA: PorV/PorQ family protein [Bacteroidota bacterium]
MKKLMHVILMAALFSAQSTNVFAQSFNKAGRTAFQFVKIGVGARQASIGEAAISIVRDVNASYWNPAGISGIATSEASFSYATWFADTKYYSAAAGIRWEGIGTFALSFSSLDYGSITEALVSSPTGSADTRTGKSFTGGDMLIGFSAAREFTDRLSIGATVKMLQEKLFTYDVKVFAYDIGTNYDIGYKGMRIAMSAQNFGPSVKWLEHSNRSEGYELPLMFRVGTAFNLVNEQDGLFSMGGYHRFTVAVDAVHTNDYGDRLHVGGEYWLGSTLAMRAGYRFNYDEGNLSVGIGLNQVIGEMDVRLDYAYVNYTYLESPHRITLSVAY